MDREIDAASDPERGSGEDGGDIAEPTERERALRAGALGFALGAVLAALARTTRRR